MIARIWAARSTPERAPTYAEHLKNQVLPTLKTIDGYGGAMLLERAAGGAVEIVVITFWESLDAIRYFAGIDCEQAVVADEAAALLTEFDRRVKHYDVAVSSLETNLKKPPDEGADAGEIVAEMAGTPVEDSLMDELPARSSKFQTLVAKSKVSPRKPFDSGDGGASTG
jgi:heme-degrading monooxygenase HmoA